MRGMWAGLGFVVLSVVVGCGSDDEGTSPASTGGSAGMAGVGGAGTGGTAGSGGTAGTGGKAGNGGSAGASGSATGGGGGTAGAAGSTECAGGPPSEQEVGPRVALSDDAGGSLQPGTYSALRFTARVSFASGSGTYSFVDCDFVQGLDAVVGGAAVSRVVSVEHSRVGAGLYFEDAGQANWTIRWSHLIGEGQGLRPKGLTGTEETATLTPMVVEDSIVENTSSGTPEAHVEAMQALGGNQMTFTRVRFITPGPYVDGTTGQTASINFGAVNSTFTSCEFLTAGAFYYTIYATKPNVSFTCCRIAQGLAGYFYPEGSPVIDRCTDYDTGAAVQ